MHISATLCFTCAYFYFFEEVAASELHAVAATRPRAQGSRGPSAGPKGPF